METYCIELQQAGMEVLGTKKQLQMKLRFADRCTCDTCDLQPAKARVFLYQGRMNSKVVLVEFSRICRLAVKSDELCHGA